MSLGVVRRLAVRAYAPIHFFAQVFVVIPRAKDYLIHDFPV